MYKSCPHLVLQIWWLIKSLCKVTTVSLFVPAPYRACCPPTRDFWQELRHLRCLVTLACRGSFDFVHANDSSSRLSWCLLGGNLGVSSLSLKSSSLTATLFRKCMKRLVVLPWRSPEHTPWGTLQRQLHFTGVSSSRSAFIPTDMISGSAVCLLLSAAPVGVLLLSQNNIIYHLVCFSPWCSFLCCVYNLSVQSGADVVMYSGPACNTSHP